MRMASTAFVMSPELHDDEENVFPKALTKKSPNSYIVLVTRSTKPFMLRARKEFGCIFQFEVQSTIF